MAVVLVQIEQMAVGLILQMMVVVPAKAHSHVASLAMHSYRVVMTRLDLTERLAAGTWVVDTVEVPEELESVELAHWSDLSARQAMPAH